MVLFTYYHFFNKHSKKKKKKKKKKLFFFSSFLPITSSVHTFNIQNLIEIIN